MAHSAHILFSSGPTTVVYNAAVFGEIARNAIGETNIPKVRQPLIRQPTMGDRSPKSVQKNASQKQVRANDANSKKQQLVTSQQATKAKQAAKKK